MKRLFKSLVFSVMLIFGAVNVAPDLSNTANAHETPAKKAVQKRTPKKSSAKPTKRLTKKQRASLLKKKRAAAKKASLAKKRKAASNKASATKKKAAARKRPSQVAKKKTPKGVRAPGKKARRTKRPPVPRAPKVAPRRVSHIWVSNPTFMSA